MNINKLGVVGFVIFNSIAIAQANNNNWISLGSSNEQNYYLNLSSVKETQKNYGAGKYVEAWIKAVIFNDLTKDGMSINDYSMLRYRFDCNEQKLGMLFFQNYKQNGSIIGKSYTNSYANLDYAIPDTVGENILIKTCMANEIKQGRLTSDDFE